MHAIPRLATVVLISALASIFVHAEDGRSATPPDPTVNARQGPPTSFHSPMILETVFPADQSTWTNEEWISGAPYAELGQFSCDGVHIKNLRIRPQLIVGPDGQNALVEFRATILNVNSGDSHDKVVTIHFDLLNGDQLVSGVTTKPKKASDTDEGGYGIGAKLTVLASALKTDPMTKLRITVTTENY